VGQEGISEAFTAKGAKIAQRRSKEGMADFDTDLMQAVAEQLMGGSTVTTAAQNLEIDRVGKKRLRMARFDMNGREYQAIEQNPEKPSAWGKLTRQGHRVVQFRDVDSNKYVAVAVDGKIKLYGR